MNKKITVVHILTQLEWGGAQENTVYTCAHLDHSRFEAVLLTTPGRYMDELEPETRRGFKIILLKNLCRKINPLKDALAFFEIRRILKDLNPGIVHTHSSKAGILGRLAAWSARVPVIVHTAHGFGFNPEQNPLVRGLFIFLERFVSRFTTRWICVSEQNIQTGIELKLFQKKNVSLIRSGISFLRHRNALRHPLPNKKALFKIPLNAQVVGTVACFKPQKAPLDFVRTAAIISRVFPDIHFVMIGDGFLKEPSVRLVKKFGLSHKFHFPGWQSDVESWIRTFDVFLLTSLWEGLPRVIPEAMILKTPVVATSVDGNRDIIQHEKTGFLASPHDVGALAGYVIKIIRSPELGSSIAKNAASNLPGTFDIDRMVEMLDDLYSKLPGSSNSI